MEEIELFYEDVNKNNGTYFIRDSGTYTLCRQESDVKQLCQQYNSCIENNSIPNKP